MDREINPSAVTPPSLSEAMERIMANPQLISMVASALGAPRKQDAEMPAADETETERQPQEVSVDPPSTPASAAPTGTAGEWVGTLLPLLSGAMGEKGGGKKSSEDSRACLLRALKPYVSEGRREAIDTMIRIGQISELLKQLS